MAEIVCDTSFLIHLASGRAKSISDLDRIGQLRLVVPETVREELMRLSEQPDKSRLAAAALKLAEGLKAVPIRGRHADEAIVEHVRWHGGMVATMDGELKARIKALRGSIVSFANDRIVLEE